jgi:peptidoglycan/LPS O-acetylase OafA/YrhL
MKYRSDIDGLRCLAVVPVVLFHANVSGAPGGFVGVDVFFVISGFLITTIIHRELTEGRFSLIGFYERRVRRILPALFAVTSAVLVAGWFTMTPADYDQLGQSILAALLFVSNGWFWQNSGGYTDGATSYLPMLHTWSLAVEEQFYIFFPLLLLLVFRLGGRFVRPALLVLTAGSLLLAIWATPRMPDASFYLLPTRAWELGLGALLAVGLIPTHAPRALREVAGVLGLAGVLLPVVFYNVHMEFPGLAAMPPVIGAALVIWAGTAGPVAASRLLSLRPFVIVGLISYSLYLWHWPINAFARYRLATIELDLAWQVSTIFLSLILAWVSWRIVERPFRIRPAQGGLTRSKIFAASSLYMAGLAGVAAILLLTDGAAKQRFSSDQLAALAKVVNHRAYEDCTGARAVEDLCVFNETQAPNGVYLLWGDSHAESLLPALIELTADRQKSLVFANRGACVPIPGVARSDLPARSDRRCEIFRTMVLQHVLENEAIEVVILAARWPLYVEGRLFPDRPGKPFRLTRFDTASDGPNVSVAYEALNDLVARLSADRKTVLLAGSVPEISWDVAKRMSSKILFDVPMPGAVEASQVMARQERSNDMLERLEKTGNVMVVNLAGEICATECPTHIGTDAYYVDNHHYSPLGALKLALPVLRAALGPDGVSTAKAAPITKPLIAR